MRSLERFPTIIESFQQLAGFCRKIYPKERVLVPEREVEPIAVTPLSYNIGRYRRQRLPVFTGPDDLMKPRVKGGGDHAASPW
jgi:hypothetical protein